MTTNKIAYFDCQCGAAGDMIAAAMIDAGLDVGILKNAIKSLRLEELKDIEIRTESRNGIRALRFIPVVQDQEHEHSHCEGGDEHKSHHHHHHHQHRGLKEITDIISRGQFSEKAKLDAIAVFRKIAEVEGKIHGKEVEQVHFHEIAATDSIVDIVSCCVGFDYFKFDKIYCSTVSMGGGTVKCQHGTVPVPAPATAALVEGLTVKDGPVDCELLTPTGAALLAHFVTECKPMPAAKIIAAGYGCGTKDFSAAANVLRIRIAQQDSETADDDAVWLVETNIDDCSGEIIAFISEKLSQKALDVWTAPIYMKKNRPAVTLSVLCGSQCLDDIEDIMLSSGLTLGLRKTRMQRTVLKREFVTKQTRFGTLTVKQGIYKGKVVFSKPEYESLAALADKNGISPRRILADID